MAQKAIKVMSMIPMHTSLPSESAVDTIFEHYKEDMPYPDSFVQEVKLWNHMWDRQDDKPSTLYSLWYYS